MSRMLIRISHQATAILVLALLVAISVPATTTTLAYNNNGRWPQGVKSANYAFNSTQMNQLPGLGGQGASVEQAVKNAATEWNKASWWNFNYNSSSTNTWGIYYTSAGEYAVALTYVNGSGDVSRMTTQFNTRHTWHLNGTTPDVFRVALHEFGHWLKLGDNPGYTFDGLVMTYPTDKPALFIDDKQCATMIYGFWSQFEVSQYLGVFGISPTYRSGVGSFSNCGSGNPDYWTYTPSAEGIPTSPSGGRAMRFRGCAVANGSSPNYAYMTLASLDHNSSGNQGQTQPCGNACYLKVRSGMKLRWHQYNATKCTVTIDLEFTDLTNLRDSGLTDTAGDSVHAKNRSCTVTPQGSWFSVEIDLSPLAGKTIKRWMVIFDDPNSSGTWRTYFDTVRVYY